MQYIALRMGSQEGDVLQNFGRLALTPTSKQPAGSRVFFPPTICGTMPLGPPVEVQLEEIDTILKNQCKPMLNQLFQYLHQKLAPMGSIAAEHKKKHAELKDLDAKIKKAWDRAKSLFGSIPFMNNLDGQRKALSCMLEIPMQVSQLADASKNLGDLLRSEARNKALEYYKKTIKECEKLSSLSSIKEKIQKLQMLVERVMRELSGTVAQEVYEIHDTIFLYLQYAARSFRNEVPKSDTALCFSADQIVIRLKEKLFENLVPDLDVKDPQPDPKSLENLCVEASKSLVLPTENTFRNAPWVSMFTLLPVVGRYTQISTQIGALEGIAKALISLENQFQEHISKINSADFENNEQFTNFAATLAGDLKVCLGLGRLADVQVRSLSLVPLAPELHAGWNYALAISKQAKMQATTIKLFQQNMNRVVLLASAVKSLKRSHNVVANNVDALWRATRAVCALPDEQAEDSEVYAVISQTLAQNALEALRLTREEQQLPKLLSGSLQGNFSISGISQDLMMSYCKKGFLRYLHFPAADARTVDFDFEKVFYTLKYDPAYKATFQACLESSTEFWQLHDAYIGQHENLYALLIKNQFNKDHTLRLEADFTIYKVVNEPAFEQKPLLGIVKPLLFRWALARFEEYCKQPRAEGFLEGIFDVFNPDRIDLSMSEKNILARLFAEYVSDPIEKKFWDGLYPAGEMDKAHKEFEKQFPSN